MNKIYIYVDQESKKILNNSTQKVLLIGSDFGWSNFGDILQLKSIINFHKKNTNLSPILVFNIMGISNKDYVDTMRKMYDIEAILFTSSCPMSFSSVNIDLELLSQFNNVVALHMYGGGFLNSYWGNFVLNITEDFIVRFQLNNYVISGQQIEKDFAKKLVKHVETFKPKIIGARDIESQQYLEDLGVKCHFSFDDATEEMLKIVKKIPKKESKQILGHINISSYTDSDEKLNIIRDNFHMLKMKYPEHSLSLINAFNDKRHVVRDTLFSLKMLEYTFPYDSYSIINGSNLAYNGSIEDMSLLNAEIAISSSYHVTMMMHFAGIPCWMLSNNKYYDQKRTALGLQESFESFLKSPSVPSYQEKLFSREKWYALLKEVYLNFDISNTKECTLKYNDAPRNNFIFKANDIAPIQDLRKKQKALQKCRQQLKGIKSSLSCKITLPLRKLRKWL